MNPTVFVVDDDDDLRRSLVQLLLAMKFTARGFESAEAFHRFYEPGLPGCLILDIRMPGQSGLELYERLLREGKRLPVIFITAHANVTTAVAAMKTGAIEFLEKPFDRQTLLDRVTKALTLDRQWRSQERKLADLERRISQLTSREQETLELIVAGEPNKSIAARSGVSERAIEMRRAQIMKKLHVDSLGELVDAAVTYRILSDLRTAARQQEFAAE